MLKKIRTNPKEKKRRLGPKIKDDQLKTLAIADKLMTV